MIKRTFFVLSLAVIFFSCDLKEKEKLRSEVDSLKQELGISQQMMATLEDVGVMMDSIDASRDVLRTSMIEGTSYDEYSDRMKEIHNYIKESQNKIADLEKSLKSSKASARSYSSSLAKIKDELKARNEELVVLQASVDKYRNENESLVKTVELQKSELADRLAKIDSSEAEVVELEKKVSTMLSQARIDEAEAYFLRAQALETAADRTKFAPRKKKATQKEALELYRMAVFYGKKDAESKVKELEEEVG